MRGWLNDVRSYLPPVQIGEVMRAGGIGHVISSKAEGLKEGDLVGWLKSLPWSVQGQND